MIIEFLPGPWEKQGREIMAGDRHVATIQVSHGVWDVNEANARLIAAAPELLEALQDLLEFLDPNECIGDEWALVARAKVAVDKALGRSTAPPASAEASGQAQLSPDP